MLQNDPLSTRDLKKRLFDLFKAEVPTDLVFRYGGFFKKQILKRKRLPGVVVQPLIPDLEKQRQENLCELEAKAVPSQPGLHKDPV